MRSATLYNTEFLALRDTDTVGNATQQMLAHHVTDLPIVDASGRFLGMFKLERVLASLLPKAALIGIGMTDLAFVTNSVEEMRQHMRDIEHRRALEFLVGPGHTVGPQTSPLEIVLMLYRGANNVPVVAPETGKLVGMASARDILLCLHHDPAKDA